MLVEQDLSPEAMTYIMSPKPLDSVVAVIEKKQRNFDLNKN